MAKQQNALSGTAAISQSLCGALVTAAMWPGTGEGYLSTVLHPLAWAACWASLSPPRAVLHYGMAATRHAVAAPTLCAATVAVEVAVAVHTCPDCVAAPAATRWYAKPWPAS